VILKGHEATGGRVSGCDRGTEPDTASAPSPFDHDRPFANTPSRLLKKSERAVKNHEQIGIKTGPFMNQSAATLSFSTAC
jgi:hypothetical protein